MTTSDFRANQEDCIELDRMLNSRTFKKAIEAAMTDLDLTHSHILENMPDASERVELRLQQQRKGHTDLLAALKMMCDPIEPFHPEPEPTYGAEQKLPELAEQGWIPVNK